jgi:lysophospholipase L1-like esterase
VTAATFLALGDSYTVGEGVAPDERWPEQLVRRLGQVGLRVAPPRIVAATGWTTDELNAAISAAGFAPGEAFDLVSLLIGVNNQYRGRPLDVYRREFAGLLARAAALAGGRAGRVLVLSIPDWGVTPFADGRDRAAIAHDIDAFNAAACGEVGRTGARWVDVTSISRSVRDDWLAADGLHPSASQYAAWAAATADAAWAALQDTPAG